MAGTKVDVGTGTTVVFGTSAFTANLTSVTWDGMDRASVETSHMGTAAPGAGKHGNKTYIPGDFSDPGEVTMEIHFDPDKEPPIDQPIETITVSFPLVAGDATPASWAASGFVTSFSVNDPIEDLMTATMVIKLSGNITLTAAA